MTSTEQHM